MLKSICALFLAGLLWCLTAEANDAAITNKGFSTQALTGKHYVAELYLPERDDQTLKAFPVVIVIGGSSGGMRKMRGQWLAQQGFVALSLAYFRYTGLPETLDNLPVESIIEAIDDLQTLTEIDASRVGIWAVSRGTELTFLAASLDQRIQSIAAMSPSSVAWHGARSRHAWAIQGQAVQSLTFDRSSDESILSRVQTALAKTKKVKAAQFQFEKINGSILLISGQNDRIWPSEAMSKSIVNELKSKHFPHAVKHKSFPTGHSFGAKWRAVINDEIASHFRATLKSKD